MHRSILRSGSLAVYVILAIYLTNTPTQWSSASLIKRSLHNEFSGMSHTASQLRQSIQPHEISDNVHMEIDGELSTAAHDSGGREGSPKRKLGESLNFHQTVKNLDSAPLELYLKHVQGEAFFPTAEYKVDVIKDLVNGILDGTIKQPGEEGRINDFLGVTFNAIMGRMPNELAKRKFLSHYNVDQEIQKFNDYLQNISSFEAINNSGSKAQLERIGGSGDHQKQMQRAMDNVSFEGYLKDIPNIFGLEERIPSLATGLITKYLNHIGHPGEEGRARKLVEKSVVIIGQFFMESNLDTVGGNSGQQRINKAISKWKSILSERDLNKVSLVVKKDVNKVTLEQFGEVANELFEINEEYKKGLIQFLGQINQLKNFGKPGDNDWAKNLIDKSLGYFKIIDDLKYQNLTAGKNSELFSKELIIKLDSLLSGSSNKTKDYLGKSTSDEDSHQAETETTRSKMSPGGFPIIDPEAILNNMSLDELLEWAPDNIGYEQDAELKKSLKLQLQYV